VLDGNLGRESAGASIYCVGARTGARVRDAAPTPAGEDEEESRLPAEAGHLAAGGLALIEEMQAIRRRLDALEVWRRTQEGRARKRASR
jgi:hypothetical protein